MPPPKYIPLVSSTSRRIHVIFIFVISYPLFMYDFMTLFAENVTEVDFDAERDDIVKFYSTFTPPPANKLQVILCTQQGAIASLF
jgi:hypothetical protein